MSLVLFITKKKRYDEINTLSIKCNPEKGEECIGGYARIVGAVKMLQENVENSIYLNAGDNFHGTLWYDIFKWNVTTKLLNLYPADVMVIFQFKIYYTMQQN